MQHHRENDFDEVVEEMNNTVYTLVLSGMEMGQVESLIRLSGQGEVNKHLAAVSQKINTELLKRLKEKAEWPSEFER